MYSRRKFLVQSSMGAVALSILPYAIWKKSHFSMVSLPKLAASIRHGAPSRAFSLTEGPSWIDKMERNRFFGNGYTSGISDIHSHRYLLEGKELRISWDAESVWINTINLLKEFKFMDRIQTLELDKQTSIYVSSSSLEVKASASSEIWAFFTQGKGRCNDCALGSEEALWYKGEKNIVLKAEEGERIILIKRKAG